MALRVGDLIAIVMGKVEASMKRILAAVAIAVVGLGGVLLLAQDQTPGAKPIPTNPTAHTNAGAP